MKQAIISIFLILICWVGYGQTTFPITQNLGSKNTLVKTPDYGGIQSGHIPYSFSDTSSANAALPYLKYYCGVIIYTTDVSANWYRSCYGGGYRWVMIDPAGIPSSSNSYRLYGNSGLFTGASGNVQFGFTVPNYSIDFITNNTSRFVLDEDGIGAETGTTVGLGYDPSNGNILTEFSGGGSGTVVVRDSVSALAPILYNSSTGVFSADTSTSVTGLATLYQNSLKADKVTLMNAGFGLLGGGSLATDRTFNADSTVLATQWYVDSSIVAIPTPTWQQTLDAGSDFDKDNSVNLAGYGLEFTGGGGTSVFSIANVLTFSALANSGALLSLTSTESQLVSPVSATRFSNIYISTDSIWFKPSLGNFIIDTLTNDVGTHSLRYNPTTGLVSYADTTSGGGGDNFANADLTFTGTRLHDMVTYELTLSGDDEDALLNINPSGYNSQLRAGDGTARSEIRFDANSAGTTEFNLSSEDGSNTVLISGRPNDNTIVYQAGIHEFSGSIGVEGTPDASSILDLQSTDKGLLIPRMTEIERDAIGTPATGLMIFQTDGTAGFYYYNGSAWTAIGSGGGGATTALDNLASVAINTSLLPATDDAIDLGSPTKQWRDIYMTGASLYMDGVKTLQATGLTMPTGAGLKTRTTATNTLLLQAYDVDGASYTTFGTLTAGNTPTFDLNVATTFGSKTVNTLISDSITSNAVTIRNPESGDTLFAEEATNEYLIKSLVAGSNITLTPTDTTIVIASTGGGSSPLTTKGDIYTYTTVDARLPVGTNGQVLSANSATSTGLEWVAAGSGSPGGSTTQMQYNNAGAFAGTSGATATSTQVTLAKPSINNIAGTYTTTATAAGTTTLTVTSTYDQFFTGTTTQDCVLPDATTLTVGMGYHVVNNSTGIVTVKKNGGTTVKALAAGTEIFLQATDISSAAGAYQTSYSTDLAIGTGTATHVDFAAGTTSVSPINLAPGTLKTTPADGDIEMNGDAAYITTDAGNRGVIPAVNLIIQSSSYALTSTTSEQKLFNAVTNGALTLETGTYFFEGLFSISGLSATSGNGAFDILGAGTSTLGTVLYHSVGVDGNTGTAGTQTGSTMITAQSPASMQTAGTNTNWNASLRGTFRVTAAGTIIPSVSLVTAAAGTVAAGSYFRVWRAGSTSLTSVGQWN